MSEKKELNEQELEQVSGGGSAPTPGALALLTAILQWDVEHGNPLQFLAELLEMLNKNPVLKNEFQKLLDITADPSIPQAEKDKLKEEFIKKYFSK